MTPEQRTSWIADFEIKRGLVPAWLREGVREIVTAKADPIAALQAQMAGLYPDPAERMLALADPKPGTPEAALFNAVVGKPAAFIATTPETFIRVE